MKEDEKMINKERLLKNFLEYIAIDSESGDGRPRRGGP